MKNITYCLIAVLSWVILGSSTFADEPKAKDKKDQFLTEKQVKKIVEDLWKKKEEAAKKKADKKKKEAEEKKKKEAAAKKQKEAEEKARKEAEKQAKAAEGTSSVVGEDLKYSSITWRNGLRFSSKDKAFKIHVGGRIHSDFTFWNAENDVINGAGGVGPLQDGAAFRRARIRVNGTIYETVSWLMEYGFENGSPAFFDVFGQINNLPYLGKVRIGHFREPFSMDALTAGNDLTFVERSLIQDAFVPFRNMGILATNMVFDKRATWALGAFRSVSNSVAADAGDRNYAVTGRLTWTPWYALNGVGALHLGIAGSYRHNAHRNARGAFVPTGGLPATRFATRPEERVNAPLFANTGFLVVDNHQLLGLEFGYGNGPFLLQAEYVGAFVPDSSTFGSTGPVRDAFFHGGYVQASYFLTGEHRPYARDRAVFARAKPHENFFRVKTQDGCNAYGLGAWEAATRYSYINLNSVGINGGILHDVSFGLNWHLNPNCRLMTNYILSWRDAAGNTSDGLTRIMAARFQVDF